MRVWLKRKLADCIDGVDISDYRVGDTLELSTRSASLLVAEEWAEPDRRVRDVPPPHSERRVVGAARISDRASSPAVERATAADNSYRGKDGRHASQSTSRRS
jgi:hypothetical protein